MSFTYQITNEGLLNNILYGNLKINQLDMGLLDKSLINVYLRLIENEEIIKVISLIDEADKYQILENGIKYCSEYGEVSYLFCDGMIITNCQIKLEKTKYDLIYNFDIGLGEEGLIKTNEAYASQYIDYKVIKTNDNLQIGLRRSIDSSSGNPGCLVGSDSEIIGYSTDGYQFYQTTYKTDGTIKALYNRHLNNEVYQYEFTNISLQTKEYDNSQNINFYIKIYEDLPNRILTVDDVEKVIIPNVSEKIISEQIFVKNNFNNLNGDFLTNEQINHYFPKQEQVEKKEGNIYSFFLSDSTHVVTNYKERLMERNHGTILISGSAIDMNDDVVCSTNYMNGFLNGQIAIGNTKFNQLTTPLRNSLNTHKSSGQRIVITINNEKYLLSTPSLFEIGLNYVKYYYVMNGLEVIICNYLNLDNSNINLEIKCNQEVDIQILTFIEEEFTFVNETFIPVSGTFVSEKCPELNYKFSSDDKMELSNNILEINKCKCQTMSLTISASKEKNSQSIKSKEFSSAKNEYYNWFKNLSNGFNLQSSDEKITKFNHLYLWYIHNALVHFSSPKGLEQYVGAAWGTRDVLQGPVELFKSLDRLDINRKILLKVFSNQFIEDGSWPQWFMFDEYSQVCSDESHGDVIVWPIKALGDYLQDTEDYSILEEKVSYKQRDQEMTYTDETFSIKEHLLKELEYINNNLFMDTNLSSYGDGDWDDTLQPKNEIQRKTMVSGWTTSLTYQALGKLANVLESVDKNLSEKLVEFNIKLKVDYNKYVMKDGIASGFVYHKDGENLHLLHPSDKFTNIKYRLLPINRNIISGLFTKEQAKNSLDIVKDNMECIDGVRLMSSPAFYNGGLNEIFKRAEQASTVGREVGLLYVHAHLRYVEAISALGECSALNRLNQVQPFDIDHYVDNSMLRQRNMYFSSSEGDFKNRYEFQENFSKLKNGTIATKSGWRLYSSGPGIYLNQFISNVIGMRLTKDKLIIDPVLNSDFDQTVLNLSIRGREYKITYIQSDNKGLFVNGEKINLESEQNSYRNIMGIISLEKLATLEQQLVIQY